MVTIEYVLGLPWFFFSMSDVPYMNSVSSRKISSCLAYKAAYNLCDFPVQLHHACTPNNEEQQSVARIGDSVQKLSVL
jgi:hypothetical protein